MTESTSLRTRVMDETKTAMKAGQKERVAVLRMIGAKIKDADIAGRAQGKEGLSEDEIISALRGMVKSRQDSVRLYREGGRDELAAKEESEIAVIREFLPPEMDDAALEAAVKAAIAEAGATSMKDMGKVMGALKAKFGANLDLGRANGLVKAALSAG
ncbi:amidotransferase GatB/YqeY subunit [Acetobacter estunensis NRIC 0472]|uniref:GatB/YqeY domain-containing protein n=1 Tax=Acetobacter estunensis TaxID=104097 RepID=A0A967EHQ5_9PROT|nr:GatB/YqeY domain-containing protein [Acetobacter estunensis]NHO53992.1 GatB/YqeY domain-containing protein [Acetobacter estunensis]GBQ20643.1 amidotransferase GatB/YqeY subunit [Acetobacter estunensis NRIC 0472]